MRRASLAVWVSVALALGGVCLPKESLAQSLGFDENYVARGFQSAGFRFKRQPPRADGTLVRWYHDKRTGSSLSFIGPKGRPVEASLTVVHNAKGLQYIAALIDVSCKRPSCNPNLIYYWVLGRIRAKTGGTQVFSHLTCKVQTTKLAPITTLTLTAVSE